MSKPRGYRSFEILLSGSPPEGDLDPYSKPTHGQEVAKGVFYDDGERRRFLLFPVPRSSKLGKLKFRHNPHLVDEENGVTLEYVYEIYHEDYLSITSRQRRTKEEMLQILEGRKETIYNDLLPRNMKFSTDPESLVC